MDSDAGVELLLGQPSAYGHRVSLHNFAGVGTGVVQPDHPIALLVDDGFGVDCSPVVASVFVVLLQKVLLKRSGFDVVD